MACLSIASRLKELRIDVWQREGMKVSLIENEQDEEEEDAVLLIRPPPEPQPRKWRMVVIRKLGQDFYFLAFVYFNCLDHAIYFCLFLVFCCKTVNLNMGDGRTVLIVFGSFVPINGSTSYIASVEVINSDSGS
ncbi:unnamed protein product, partial [Cuscuta epithymum]